jgi:hypothetical protein
VANPLHLPSASRRSARQGSRVIDVHHHVVCRHQVEIEVWPPRAQINFQDDWTANPASRQTRFEATVYNSGEGHLWEVRAVDGGPGAGSIDASGLYKAPVKGALPSGFTEIIAVTAREDRLRRAYAWVTLVGAGPEPVTPPTVDIWPKRVNLYYQQGADNSYMDDCNKKRLFGAIIRDGAGASLEWLVNGVNSGAGPSFLYQMPNAGGAGTVTIRARLQGQPSVFDEAKVLQLNYSWPGG